MGELEGSRVGTHGVRPFDSVVQPRLLKENAGDGGVEEGGDEAYE